MLGSHLGYALRIMTDTTGTYGSAFNLVYLHAFYNLAFNFYDTGESKSKITHAMRVPVKAKYWVKKRCIVV